MGDPEYVSDEQRDRISTTTTTTTPAAQYTALPSTTHLEYGPIASRYGMMSSSNEGLIGSSSGSSSMGRNTSSSSFHSNLETWTGAPAPHPGVLSFVPVVLAKLAVVLWIIALLKPHVYTRDVQLARFDLVVNTGMYEVCYTVQGDAMPSSASAPSVATSVEVGKNGSSTNGGSIRNSGEKSNSSVTPLPPQSSPANHRPKHRYGHSPHRPFQRQPVIASSASPEAASMPIAGDAAGINGVPAPVHVQDLALHGDPHHQPQQSRPPLAPPVVVKARVAPPTPSATVSPPTAHSTPRSPLDDNTTSIDVGDCRPLEPDCTVMLDDRAWPAPPVPWSWRGLVVSGANCDKFVAAREMTVAMSVLNFLASVSYLAWLCMGSPMGSARYRHTLWASFSILLTAVSTILSVCVIAVVAVVFQREHTIPLNRASYDYSMYLLIAGMLSSLLATASMTMARVRKPNYYV